ncbi:MAG: hypothetical protein U1G07_24835 [Verrucomicrobiota bacterium]
MRFLEAADPLLMAARTRLSEHCFRGGLLERWKYTDLDQSPGGSRTPAVDDIGDDFFADTAFAGNEDPAFRIGHEGGIAKDGLGKWTGRDNCRGQRFVAKDGLLIRFDPGGLADGVEQFVEIDRFGEIIDGAVAHGIDGIADVGIGRHEQDGQDRKFLAGAPKGFEAGHARHAHVRDHHVHPALPQRGQSLLT